MSAPALLPVFAGLGSDALFSEEALDRAAQDALVPDCALLLRACHEAFVAQVSQAVESQVIGSDVIRLHDFPEPAALVRPPPRYRHGNVLMQHTTLYLQQALRHVASTAQRHGPGENKLIAAAGFCVGLLPAAALATAGPSSLALITRVVDFFQVALWVGIHSESYRRAGLALAHEDRNTAPRSCSYVVDGLSPDAAAQLVAESERVFVSAVLSPSRVTLSGNPQELASFISQQLPPNSRSRPTQVFSLYHHSCLDQVRQHVYRDLSRYTHFLQTEVQPAAPLLSALTGEPLVFTNPVRLRDVVATILDEVFLQPVDWVAVQASIASLATKQSDSTPVRILNYGPGIGMSQTPFRPSMPDNIEIIDAARLAESVSAGLNNLDPASEDIAIVGMAVDLPGAPDTDTLWERLMQGANACTEIPKSRFDIKEFAPQPGQKRGVRTLNAKHGNFIENPFLFDAELFDISRREAKSMDPQQRLLLQTAYRALEDSGYVPDSSPSFSRDTFGCWIGNATLDYVDNLRDDIDVYYSPGTLRTFLSARISYVFGWSGPSITLDTACSSSIVALHQAARSILAGDCRAALVGAANTISSPNMYLGLDRAHFLSPSGQCKAFDASADGYCRAEGVGAFVIKKLSDAIAEGDRIHAVIKAVEINQSGNTHSITHPHVPTQEALFNHMFRKARIDPHEVTAVELHGTGTQAGDPNEVESVRRVLCSSRLGRRKHPLHLTSIKANLGHSEAASGLAGLAKLVLMLRHGRIPPQVSLKTLNPRIRKLGGGGEVEGEESDGAVIDREAADWPRGEDGKPRLAMLNNFGAGGSNAAVLLTEYIPTLTENKKDGKQETLLCGISAKSERALAALQAELARHLEAAAGELSLVDVCATLTSRRQVYDWRVAVTAGSVGELADKMRTATAQRVVRSAPWARAEAVFVFSGQGSQYLGMGRELMSMYDEFAETVLECDRWLLDNKYPGCRTVIEGVAPPASDSKPDASLSQAFQSALFVLEVALARLLISWGIVPSAVVGHSLGEYAALVTAGVLDLFDGLKLVALRASLMMQHCELGRTSMLAVNNSAASMQALLSDKTDNRFAELEIACNNSGTDCVVGGPVAALAELKAHLRDTRGTKSKLLDVPLAFHTRAMDPIMSEFRTFAARELRLSAPTIPVVSNVLGRTVYAGEAVFTPAYFADHCRNTVAFDDGIKDFLANTDVGTSALRFVEVGPHPSLLPMLRARAREGAADSPREPELLPALTKTASASDSIHKLLRHFYETADGINWRKVFLRRGEAARQPINLPTMPFFKEEFHVPYRETKALPETPQPAVVATANSFIARVIQQFAPGSKNGQAIYDTPAALLKEFITGHLVCEQALCPASVYHEMALAALADIEPDAGSSAAWSLTKVSYLAPFVYREDAGLEQILRVVVTQRSTAPDGYDFTVLSYNASSDPDTTSTAHCRGVLRGNTHDSLKLKYSRLWASVKGKMGILHSSSRSLYDMAGRPSSSYMQVFSKTAMYDKIFTRVVAYSAPYQMVQSIHVNDASGEAFASCVYPETRLKTGVAVPAANAIFMDVLLHVAGFVANLKVANDIMGICSEVGAATVLRAPGGGAAGAPFDIFCSTFEMSGQDAGGTTLTIAEAYAMDSQGLLAVFKGMVFQHVKMSRISQALSLAHRPRGQHTAGRQNAGTVRINSAQPPRVEVAATVATAVSTTVTATPAHVNVRDVVAKACGLGPGKLTADSALDSIGVDSLLMIELHSELSTLLNISLPHDAIAECATVGDIESLVASLIGTSTDTSGSSSPSSSNASSAALTAASTTATWTPVATPGTGGSKASMTEIVASVCGADPAAVTPGSELKSLGIDSLMTLELEDSLRAAYGVDISSLGVQNCRTVADVEKLINGSSNAPIATQVSAALARLVPQAEDEPAPSSLSLTEQEKRTIPQITRLMHLAEQPELIQPADPHHPNAAPLFLIHDGSGICTHYRRLQPLHRPVFAIHDSRFLLSDVSSSNPWPSLPAMASHYADLIASATTPAQPCLLGGWSFGGVVAFEAARTLLSRGRNVAGVVLIDSPPPLDHIPLSADIIRAVTTPPPPTPPTTSLITTNTTTPNPQTTPSALSTATRKLIHHSFRTCASLIGSHSRQLPSTHPTDTRPIPHIILLRSSQGWVPPAWYSGPAIPANANPWLQDRSDVRLATEGWEVLVGGRGRGVKCVDIPGDHFGVFEGGVNVRGVSEAVGRACEELTTKGSRGW